MKAHFFEHSLHFARPAGTSRGVLTRRPVWYLFFEEEGRRGIGECAPLPGLSRETADEVRQLLTEIVQEPDLLEKGATEQVHKKIKKIPSVRFAVETARRDLQMGGTQLLFSSDFTSGCRGIPINGLIWMGDTSYMKEQITAKLKQGFHCIKLKIGSLQFAEELGVLQEIRREYSADEVTLRVDANGAFSENDAAQKMMQLAELDIHSIEQPIMAGQRQQLAALCKKFSSTLPIALDEELIGVETLQEKNALLDTVKPQYLVLKPSLHGGWSGCDEWITLAKKRNIGWWITSYLESNIGLNAIAQWAYQSCETHNSMKKLHQGLGTGGLFTNNIESPLVIQGEQLFYDISRSFQFPVNFFNAALS